MLLRLCQCNPIVPQGPEGVVRSVRERGSFEGPVSHDVHDETKWPVVHPRGTATSISNTSRYFAPRLIALRYERGTQRSPSFEDFTSLSQASNKHTTTIYIRTVGNTTLSSFPLPSSPISTIPMYSTLRNDQIRK